MAVAAATWQPQAHIADVEGAAGLRPGGEAVGGGSTLACPACPAASVEGLRFRSGGVPAR
jgi:hypothetical protein